MLVKSYIYIYINHNLSTHNTHIKSNQWPSTWNRFTGATDSIFFSAYVLGRNFREDPQKIQPDMVQSFFSSSMNWEPENPTDQFVCQGKGPFPTELNAQHAASRGGATSASFWASSDMASYGRNMAIGQNWVPKIIGWSKTCGPPGF
jgi:hypothetical protein